MRHYWRDFPILLKEYFSLPLGQLLVFPIIASLVLACMWGAIFYKVQTVKKQTFQEGLNHTQDIAYAYEQYTTRAIRQVDQITRFIVYENKTHDKIKSLSGLTDNVLISPITPALVSLADQNGLVYASSKPLYTVVSIADRPHFTQVKNSNSSDLYISETVVGRVSHQTTIQMARKLVNRKGQFDGVVVVSMNPSILSSFYNFQELGTNGFLGVAGLDGSYRSSSYSGREKVGAKILNPEVLSKSNGVMYTTHTHDGMPRFIAWRRLEGYNLIAVVGLSASEVLEPYYNTFAIWTKMGMLATIAIVALGLLTGIIYCRLELRRRSILQAKEAYRTASEGTMDGFFILEPLKDNNNKIIDFLITDANAQGAKMLHLAPNKLVGNHLSQWFSGTLGKHLFRHYRRVFIERSHLEQPEILIECDNPLKGRWLSHRAVATTLGLAVTIRDITQAKKHEESIKWLASHDIVTRLCNRAWLQDHLPAILEEAKLSQKKVALYFIDLDDFKKVNDTLGHASGDLLLSMVGDRLSKISRTDDIVCRLGGDEFTLVVKGILDNEEIARIGQRILDALKAPINLNGHIMTIGASVGVSCFPEHGEDANMLLKRADLAMYKAKDTGKGTFEFFIDKLSIDAEKRLELERDMYAALENDEFYLVYQPKISLKDNQLLGMEALLRWKSPTRGIVGPMDFIELAERTGMIIPLGEQVLHKACQQIVQWQKMGYHVPPVSVNVSPKQLQRINLAKLLTQILEQYDLSPKALEIEITESSMMDNLELSQKQLQAIKDLGMKILVDDFGTGYSSLSLLKKFEVDVLKVDKSFIQDVPSNNGDCALVQAVISMAQSLNMEVVAEGIETEEQMAFLKQLGCHEGQGFYFSKPIEANEFSTWLKSE